MWSQENWQAEGAYGKLIFSLTLVIQQPVSSSPEYQVLL